MRLAALVNKWFPVQDQAKDPFTGHAVASVDEAVSVFLSDSEFTPEVILIAQNRMEAER